jgi:hypothetical protein
MESQTKSQDVSAGVSANARFTSMVYAFMLDSGRPIDRGGAVGVYMHNPYTLVLGTDGVAPNAVDAMRWAAERKGYDVTVYKSAPRVMQIVDAALRKYTETRDGVKAEVYTRPPPKTDSAGTADLAERLAQLEAKIDRQHAAMCDMMAGVVQMLETARTMD